MYHFGDRNVMKFIGPNGEILMVGREFTEDHKAEIYYFTDYSGEVPEVLGVQWIGKQKKKGKNPKHTGGKPEYAKVFIKELEKLDLNKKELGSALALIQYIDWKTGILMKKKPKKPMQFEDLMEALGCSRMTLSRRLKKFRDTGLIFNNEYGDYVISRKFAQKG